MLSIEVIKQIAPKARALLLASTANRSIVCANATVVPSLRPDIGVLGRSWVAVNAVSDRSAHGWVRAVPVHSQLVRPFLDRAASHVLALPHGLKVVRVYTAFQAAKMVKNQSGRNWTLKDFIGEPVRAARDAVTVGRQRRGPNPAAAGWLKHNLIEKSVDRLLVNHHEAGLC